MSRLGVLLCLIVAIVNVHATVMGVNKAVRGEPIRSNVLGVSYKRLKAKDPRVCEQKCRNINAVGIPCVAWKWKQNNKRYPKFMRKRCVLLTTADINNPRPAKGWIWGTPE